MLSGTLCRVIALLGTDRCLVCGINSVYGGAALIVCGNSLELSFHRDVFTLYRCDRHFSVLAGLTGNEGFALQILAFESLCLDCG